MRGGCSAQTAQGRCLATAEEAPLQRPPRAPPPPPHSLVGTTGSGARQPSTPLQAPPRGPQHRPHSGLTPRSATCAWSARQLPRRRGAAAAAVACAGTRAALADPRGRVHGSTRWSQGRRRLPPGHWTAAHAARPTRGPLVAARPGAPHPRMHRLVRPVGLGETRAAGGRCRCCCCSRLPSPRPHLSAAETDFPCEQATQ